MSGVVAGSTPLEPVLELRGLHVDRGGIPVLRGVDLTLGPGRVHVVLGASGSGKSTLLRACVGLVPRPSRVRAETMLLRADGATHDLRAGQSTWSRVRGEHVGLVGQDPALDLTPLRRVGSLVLEASGPGAGTQDVAGVLAGCGLPRHGLERRHGFQLSGGMAQRLALGLATARTPALVLADEPSTALDALARDELGRRLRELAADGAAVLLVTHDVLLARAFGDEVTVLADGLVVEDGPTERVLRRPRHEATRELVAVRRPSTVVPTAPRRRADHPALTVSGLVAGWRRGVPVLDGVDLEVGAGETVGVAGRSGAGKSTLVACLTGLLEPAAGLVEVAGRTATRRSWRTLRREVQLVPQDPRGSLNPWRRVADQVRDPLDIHRVGTPAERETRVAELLERVGLTAYADRRPGELSTGQCQRAAIVRALACRPSLVVADEPVTALDASLRSDVLGLLGEVVGEDGAACLVISHDLHVLEHLCERLLVLDEGRIVEALPTTDLRGGAEHPLTRALVAAHPPLPTGDEHAGVTGA